MKSFTVFACCMVLAGAAFGAAYGSLSGSVIAKEVSYGPQGSVSEILLILDTHDGNYWGVICKRSNGNLGFCNNIQQWDTIYADGILQYGGGPVGCAWLSPTSISK